MSYQQLVSPPLSASDCDSSSSSNMKNTELADQPVPNPFETTRLLPTPPISPVDQHAPWSTSSPRKAQQPTEPPRGLSPSAADAQARFRVARHYRQRHGHFLRTRIGGSTKAGAQLTLALARAKADRLQLLASSGAAAAGPTPLDMYDAQRPVFASPTLGLAIEAALGTDAAVALAVASSAAATPTRRIALFHELVGVDGDVDVDMHDAPPAGDDAQVRDILAALDSWSTG